MSKKVSISDLRLLSRPSVVTRTPSAVFSVINTFASNAVEWALGLQNTSRYCNSFAAGSPAAHQRSRLAEEHDTHFLCQRQFSEASYMSALP